MKQLLIELDDEDAARLERVAPGRSRRRSEFVRMAVRRALWDLEEQATADAYRRLPRTRRPTRRGIPRSGSRRARPGNRDAREAVPRFAGPTSPRRSGAGPSCCSLGRRAMPTSTRSSSAKSRRRCAAFRRKSAWRSGGSQATVGPQPRQRARYRQGTAWRENRRAGRRARARSEAGVRLRARMARAQSDLRRARGRAG